MVSFGAVLLEDTSQTFYGQVSPISETWIPDALAVSGHSREETLLFPTPIETMHKFAEWISTITQGQRPLFWSDNNGYDFAFINYYFWQYYGSNPFGWSSRNLNDLYKGINKNMNASFKGLRDTKHTHHPVDDAMGIAEAMQKIQKLHGIKIYDDSISFATAS